MPALERFRRIHPVVRSHPNHLVCRPDDEHGRLTRRSAIGWPAARWLWPRVANKLSRMIAVYPLAGCAVTTALGLAFAGLSPFDVSLDVGDLKAAIAQSRPIPFGPPLRGPAPELKPWSWGGELLSWTLAGGVFALAARVSAPPRPCGDCLVGLGRRLCELRDRGDSDPHSQPRGGFDLRCSGSFRLGSGGVRCRTVGRWVRRANGLRLPCSYGPRPSPYRPGPRRTFLGLSLRICVLNGSCRSGPII